MVLGFSFCGGCSIRKVVVLLKLFRWFSWVYSRVRLWLGCGRFVFLGLLLSYSECVVSDNCFCCVLFICYLVMVIRCSCWGWELLLGSVICICICLMGVFVFMY